MSQGARFALPNQRRMGGSGALKAVYHSDLAGNEMGGEGQPWAKGSCAEKGRVL